MSYVYINILEYLKIRIFNQFRQIAMSQLLFGTKFCSLSWYAADI